MAGKKTPSRRPGNEARGEGTPLIHRVVLSCLSQSLEVCQLGRQELVGGVEPRDTLAERESKVKTSHQTVHLSLITSQDSSVSHIILN